MSHDTPGTLHPKPKTIALTIGSVGVVYGDIGTSPLYALREGLAAATEGREAGASDVIGIVSLLLWLLIFIATFKYVILMLRADNRGEGGTLSLLALGQRAFGGRTRLLIALGIIGTALFFGDAIITPAISVLSAVEGVTLIAPRFDAYVIPTTIVILLTLFWFQRRGTGGVSRLFGPIMLAWFAMIALLGLRHIADGPQILAALSPIPGIAFLLHHGDAALPVLGSVFLAITGAEALYADMGHFGRRPIRIAWGLLVLPSLGLCYLGQGALVLADPAKAANPFFLMAPTWALPGLVAFSTVATVIASQAVITGAFSVARQAVQLGLLPRLEILHTSETQEGQIFLPKVNLILLASVLVLVVGFGSSARLATAYGIAVTGEMIVTTLLAFVVFRALWKWRLWLVIGILAPILTVELFLFAANLTKFTNGGYLPVSVAVFLILVMGSFVRGSELVQRKSRDNSVSMDTLLASLAKSRHIGRAPGTAVFLTAEPIVAPPALMHNLKHNGVLHHQNYIVTVSTADRPHVPLSEMAEVEPLSDTFMRVRLRFGYMDEVNVPKALRQVVKFDIMSTSFFLNRRTFKTAGKSAMPGWQKRLFVATTRAAANAHDFYRLPSNRVVELGQQITF